MTSATSRSFAALALASAAVASSAAVAAEPVQLTLKDHQFTPAQVSVAANQRFRIEIINQDTTPAEFESGDLRAEKIMVPGGQTVDRCEGQAAQEQPTASSAAPP